MMAELITHHSSFEMKSTRQMGRNQIAVGQIALVNGENPTVGRPVLVDRACCHAVGHSQKRAAIDEATARPTTAALAALALLHATDVGATRSRVHQTEAPDLPTEKLAD